MSAPENIIFHRLVTKNVAENTGFDAFYRDKHIQNWQNIEHIDDGIRFQHEQKNYWTKGNE